MKKIKNNKGITLVALIITIIVLLILAVVAISAVNGDGIISKAKLARKNYQDAQEGEQSALAGYLADIENANNQDEEEPEDYDDEEESGTVFDITCESDMRTAILSNANPQIWDIKNDFTMEGSITVEKTGFSLVINGNDHIITGSDDTTSTYNKYMFNLKTKNSADCNFKLKNMRIVSGKAYRSVIQFQGSSTSKLNAILSNVKIDHTKGTSQDDKYGAAIICNSAEATVKRTFAITSGERAWCGIDLDNSSRNVSLTFDTTAKVKMTDNRAQAKKDTEPFIGFDDANNGKTITLTNNSKLQIQSVTKGTKRGYDLSANNGGGSQQAGNVGATALTVVEAKTEGKAYTSNKVITDAYGNKITIPAGFKLASDSGEYVTKGVVIEDANGNQFVWVPVGKIYTDTAKTEANAKTIELNRYTFDSSTGAETPQGDAAIDDYYNESEYKTQAKNLSGFKTSVTNNGGYYIGRYEAGTGTARTSENDELTTVVCKYNSPVYNYVTRKQASSLSQEMYNSNDFTSDLVNSYAWDTAIVYIQTFSTVTKANRYSLANKFTSNANTGINNDKYCNICDMAGNVSEWTTEKYKNYSYPDYDYPCVVRGGNDNWQETYTSRRGCASTSLTQSNIGFRPLLYIGQ